MHSTSTLTTLLLLASTALAQTPVLVKDINPGNFSGVFTTSNAAVVGNTLYFNSVGTTLDDELWKTDGTEAGTVFVKDIYVGSQGSQQKFYTVYNSQLYFTAFNPVVQTEVWRTDDTEGAVLAAGDPCPGPCSGAFYGTEERLFGEYNGKLYFRLSGSNTGPELWVTDGTLLGTTLFKDLNPGSGYGEPFGFAVFNGKMYFAADSADVGTELWVSDGTVAGTHMVKNINTSPFGGCGMGTPVVGTDAFYFWATNSTGNGKELWKSDGTAQGTVLLKEIRSGTDGGQPTYAGYIPLTNSTWVGDKLLFSGDDGILGAELWITDGTPTGTQMLFDIRTGVSGSSIQFLTTVQGKAYFRARSSSGHELWVSDGTVAGTHLVKDINPGSGDGINPNIPVRYIAHDDKIYFTANDGTTGSELWVTDGTSAGTKLVYDLNPGTAESTPTNYQVMGDFLYFFATTQTTGTELWKLSLLTSATKDPGHTLALKVYPTFAPDGVFYLDYDGGAAADTFEVSVFDAAGRLEYHANHSLTEPLQLSIPTGVYFIRIANDEGKFVTQKVIVGG